MVKSDLVDIACTVRTETVRAWLINDGTREVWVSKSQVEIEYLHHAQSDDPSTAIATMPEWMAKEKGLI